MNESRNKSLNVNNVWRTCNKIRAALSRIDINISDCFRHLDRKNNSLLSESDFISVLSGSLARLIGLSNQEICEVADYFRAQDGRIFYTQFCSIIHDDAPETLAHPSVSGKEWDDPLQTNCLSLTEERKVEIIITKIRSAINQRNLVLLPYFQDYELISKNHGSITFAHFTRVLYFLGIVLAAEEIHLLIKKFSRDGYTLNYVAFVRAVEEVDEFFQKHKVLDKGGDVSDDFPGKIISINLPKLPRPEIGKLKTACVFPQQLHFLTTDPKSKRIRDVQEIVLRLQEHVYKNQLKVLQYFKDFDVFNVGKVTENQFERGLDALCESALCKLYLAKEEIEELKAFYKDPNEVDRICWRTFEDDLEQVFTIKHLHKHPNCKVDSPPAEVKELPRLGHQEWECTESMCKEKMEKLYRKTFDKVAHRVKERQIPLKRMFQDFDKTNRGHVSRSQLRQTLATASIPLTREEILALEFACNDNFGFRYSDFVNKLEQQTVDKSTGKKISGASSSSRGPEKRPKLGEDDVDAVLAKIKAKVVSNGIKVNEFTRQFETLNKGVVTRYEFHRGLDLLNCDLTCTELNTLTNHFANRDRPELVDYREFGDAVERAVTRSHLEKSPLATPVKHVPSKDTPRSFMNFDERQIIMRILQALAAYADRNLEDIFQDFDRNPSHGAVTKNQLIRALSLRKATSVISAREIDVLFKCFSVGSTSSSEPKFDYRSFLSALQVVRKNEFVVPF